MSVGFNVGINGLSLIKSAISDINAINATKEKEIESTGIEEVFNKILDEVQENFDNSTEKTSNILSENIDNTQFGPPVGMKIEGLDKLNLEDVKIHELDDDLQGFKNVNADENLSENNVNSVDENSQQKDNNEEDDDEEDNPMDLNHDGEVTLKEIMTYLGIKETYGKESNSSKSNSTVEEFLELFG